MTDYFEIPVTDPQESGVNSNDERYFLLKYTVNAGPYGELQERNDMHQWVVYDTVVIELSKNSPSRAKSRKEMPLCPKCATPLCRGNKFLNIGKPTMARCDKCGMQSQPVHDDGFYKWKKQLDNELYASVGLTYLELSIHHGENDLLNEYWSLEYYRKGMTPEQVVNAIDFDSPEFDDFF